MCWSDEMRGIQKRLKTFTADISCCMVCLTVHTKAALLRSTQLLQLLVQDVHSLLHTLSLGHWHLAHTAQNSHTRIIPLMV